MIVARHEVPESRGKQPVPAGRLNPEGPGIKLALWGTTVEPWLLISLAAFGARIPAGSLISTARRLARVLSCQGDVARFHHPRPDTVVVVVTSSVVHHGMALLYPLGLIKFVLGAIRKGEQCIRGNHSGDIGGDRLIANILIRVFRFPIFN